MFTKCYSSINIWKATLYRNAETYATILRKAELVHVDKMLVKRPQFKIQSKKCSVILLSIKLHEANRHMFALLVMIPPKKTANDRINGSTLIPVM